MMLGNVREIISQNKFVLQHVSTYTHLCYWDFKYLMMEINHVSITSLFVSSSNQCKMISSDQEVIEDANFQLCTCNFSVDLQLQTSVQVFFKLTSQLCMQHAHL